METIDASVGNEPDEFEVMIGFQSFALFLNSEMIYLTGPMCILAE
jgi:hypothetical protein